jgi:levanase/fructan beta-fructosidase
MSNHQTGKDYPTDPWRGAQSLPRTLFLFEEAGRLRLGQRPVQPLTAPDAVTETVSDGGHSVQIGTFDTPFARRVSLASDDRSRFRLDLGNDHGVLLGIEVDRQTGTIDFHRARDDRAPAFETHTACAMPMTDTVAFDVYFDGYLAEIFIDGGRRVYSACIFPKTPLTLTAASLGIDVIVRI